MSLIKQVWRGKSLGKLVTFLALICAADFSAFWLRFDGDIPEWAMQLFLGTLPALILVRLAMSFPFRLHSTVWQYASLWDVVNLVGASLSGTAVFIVIVRFGFGHADYPRSVYLIDTLLLIVLAGGMSMAWRLRHASSSSADQKRVLIYGAGDAGERLVRELRQNRSFGYRPVGFVDDEPRKTGQRIHGVKVLGTRAQLPAIMKAAAPNVVLIAMPSARSGTIREIAKLLLGYKVSVKILPDLSQLLDGKSEVDQLRNLSVEDLLHRPRVGLDRSRPAALVRGKRILVTGAGGSIGSELCRQIAAYGPDALILYERYENNLYAIHGELSRGLPPPHVYPVIGDVTDHARLRATMETYAPHIVFHAAAHKHVPLMEWNPCEAVKNNVMGTRMAATLASDMDVERFIMISTDKAVRPSSVMGATKRVAELIIQDMARTSRTTFTTVRFGNVLGSNGSVVPHFLQQIKAGGPVTVTHPDVERYFMLIPEAVELVLHAAALAEQGSIYVLEMGQQLKLQDLARHLIRMSGFVPDRDIPIRFTGLRPGEKLSEELVGPDETVMPSSSKEILRVCPNQIPPHEWLAVAIAELERMAHLQKTEEVLASMALLVPTFQATSRTSVLRAA
ncbi:polysaccharide biosynthesis protein [Nitrospira moscoviensis]|uniref:Capsular polysaccharide biosynthesis protein CapD n=1 Tax=Nitrospira moscoviensis TaxID=42253 RepID=A0A0K2GIF9_NITMO|nr:nucleoside-diphosphate sugar epimerase/dehydratase [Nitrospira moscoviensis]ALA60748.1 Capsular polysaccharide biosynthesis protein CapD [Nitrospira moscoviensis]